MYRVILSAVITAMMLPCKNECRYLLIDIETKETKLTADNIKLAELEDTNGYDTSNAPRFGNTDRHLGDQKFPLTNGNGKGIYISLFQK